jgi:hypothetical protein
MAVHAQAQGRMPPAPVQDQGPTLEETTNFLQEKLTAKGFFKRETSELISTYAIEEIKFNGCTIAYKTVSKWWLPGDNDPHTNSHSTTVQIKADLSALDPEGINNVGREQEFVVMANTVRKEAVFQMQMEIKSKSYVKVNPSPTYQISFHFRDEETAQKVVKALIRVATLCRNKKELF